MRLSSTSVPAALVLGVAAYASVASAAVLEIATLSNRPDLVSGGMCWCRSPPMKQFSEP